MAKTPRKTDVSRINSMEYDIEAELYDDIDIVELEKSLREFQTELGLKREQVEQLEISLDIANEKFSSANAKLQAANKEIDDKTFKLNVLTKKVRQIEEDLAQKTKSLSHLQTLHALLAEESVILKQNLQKSEYENNDLAKRVEALTAKEKGFATFHNEILKRDERLKDSIDQLNELIIEIRAEHAEVMQLAKDLNLTEEVVGKLNLLKAKCEKLKKSRDISYKSYIRSNANYQRIVENLDGRSGDDDETFFNPWKTSLKYYKERMDQKNDILAKLTEALDAEKRMNLKLLLDCDTSEATLVGVKEEKKKLEERSEKIISDLNKKIIELEEKIHKNGVNQTSALEQKPEETTKTD